ncbi:MAG TPA: hypothetical protein PLD10_04095 [Rhodopila sp.]|nr:hypothetical protein [Rhodopila sp.]
MSGSTGGSATNADNYTWIGSVVGLWQAVAEWWDITSGQKPAVHSPGPLTPVTIANPPGAPYKFIEGGGAAASIGLTGNLDFIGSYTVGGTVTVGTMTTGPAPTLTSGILVLSTGATIAAGALNVLDGIMALAGGAAVDASGPVSLGTPGGFRIPNNGTYAYTSGASSALNVMPQATVTASGDLSINAGALTDVGGVLTIGGSAVVGTAGSVIATAPLQTVGGAAARLAVTTGGTTTVAGDITTPIGMLVADGAGSTMRVGGTVTTGVGGTYMYYSGGFLDSFDGAILAINGGAIRLGGLVLDTPPTAVFADTLVYADAVSSIEIGTAGGVATDAITIDPGRTAVAVTTAGLYGNLVDNGTLVVAGGTLTQSGAVTGSGVIEIAQTATWLLDGAIASTATISFLDTGAVLVMGGSFSFSGTSYSAGTNPLAATITGFRPGDAIDFLDPVTTATYAAGSGGLPGHLTLAYGGSTVEVLTLAGTFAGDTFALSPTSSGGAVLSLTGPTVTVSAQATNADAYTWIGVSGAAWGAAANWRDTTTASTPAAFAPGRLSAVTLSASSGAASTVVSGGGTAASIAVGGWFSLAGFYAVGGALTVGTLALGPGPVITTASPAAGALTLLSGGTISTAAMTVLDGTLTIDTGATVAASAPVTVGVAAGRDIPNNGTYVSTGGASGTLGLAVGATLSAAGGLAVNNGTLADAGGLVRVGPTLTIGTVASGGSTASYNTAPAAGAVVVSGGGSLSVAGGITDLNGIAVADGIGSTLSVSGTMTAQGAGSYSDASPFAVSNYAASIAALNGGYVQAGGLILNAPSPGPSVLVDSISAVEIGSAGGAATGAITVDSGHAITTAGAVSLSGNLIDNGMLVVAGGTLVQNGSVAGTGVVRIAANATWLLHGSIAASDTIMFVNAGATLAIGGMPGSPSTPVPVAATLLDFQTGDSLILPQAVTAATYAVSTVAGMGTLTLRNGTSVVATLALGGNYTNRTFTVTPVAGGSAIGLLSDAATMGVESLGTAVLAGSGGNWSLNLGAVTVGAAALSDTIGFVNTGTGAVGALSGAFSISGPGIFTNSVFASGFAGVAAGQEEHQQVIALSSATVGVFTETIVVAPVSSSTSDSVDLANQTITVTGTVLPMGVTYNLTWAPATIVGGGGNDVFNAPFGALNSRDSLDGGGGSSNVLNLIGGGAMFDLGAPKLLANIQTITATEGTTPTVIFMRDGYSATVDLAPLSGGGGSAVIYGGSGSDVLNLSTGTDTVVLGSASESVHAGGGTALVQAAAGFAGAAVSGGSTGSTTLEITTGGTVALSAADAYVTVSLDAAAHLSLGSARFMTAIGSGGADTIIAGASGQTLTGGAGADMLIGYAGYGDRFADTSSGLNGDTIGNFGGSDTIDITDLAFGRLSAPVVGIGGSATTLGLSDGIRSVTIALMGSYGAGSFAFGNDGLGGTAIRFV